MRWFGIQFITNGFEAARNKIEDSINYGYKAFADIISSFLQESQKSKQYEYAGVNISSDRSLMRKSVSHHRREKISSRFLHTTVSEYWKDALYNHWLILIQCLILVTIIILIAPWIGSDCSNEYTYENNYFDNRPDVHLRQLRRTIEERTNSISRKPCNFMSIFTSGPDLDDKLNKRSGILKRKRTYRKFF